MTSYVHHIQHWHCKPTQFIESYLFTISSVSLAEAAQVCTILSQLNLKKKNRNTSGNTHCSQICLLADVLKSGHFTQISQDVPEFFLSLLIPNVPFYVCPSFLGVCLCPCMCIVALLYSIDNVMRNKLPRKYKSNGQQTLPCWMVKYKFLRYIIVDRTFCVHVQSRWCEC